MQYTHCILYTRGYYAGYFRVPRDAPRQWMEILSRHYIHLSANAAKLNISIECGHVMH